MAKIQRRTNLTPPRIQRRETDGISLPAIRGHAAVFNEWTTLYRGKFMTVREIIRPGAFSDALRENQDVILNFNHDNHFTLARTGSRTLTLEEDDKGLLADAELLDSQRNRDYVIGPAERGDLSGMSFAFLPREGGVKETRRSSAERVEIDFELISLDLFDVSVVANPAYLGASFDLRSNVDFSEREKAERLEIEARRDRKAFLMRSALLLAEIDS